jgi:hypothetical protein
VPANKNNEKAKLKSFELSSGWGKVRENVTLEVRQEKVDGSSEKIREL